MRFDVKLATRPPLRYTLSTEEKAPKAALRLRAAWLGQR
jgi:hypothetical protein